MSDPATGPDRHWTPTAAALVLGTLWGLAAMGTSAASVVLGDLRDDFGVGVSAVAWVLTLFALTFAAATPVFGRLADSHGPRTPYVVGVLLLAAGALVAATAPSLPVLLAGRALQGVGAGAIPVLSMAIISLRFDGRDRAVAFGRVNSALVILATAGPIVGGALGSWGGWRVPFALPLFALLLLPVAYRLAPRGGSGAPLDWPGALLVAGSAAAGLVFVQSLAAWSAITVLALVLVVALVTASVAYLRRRPDGFLPAELLGNVRLIKVSVASGSMPLVYFGVLIALPLQLAERGWTPLQTGLVMLPGAALSAGLSFQSARFVARWERVGTAIRGMSLSVAGAVLVSGMVTHPGLAVVGFMGMASGYALAQPTLVGEASASVPDRLRGGALGLFNLVFFIGAGLGSALIGGLGELIGIGPAVLVTALGPVLGLSLLWSLLRRGSQTPADRQRLDRGPAAEPSSDG